jgi:hypothetical protein
VIQYSGDVAKYLLIPILGDSEILFRAALISALTYGFIQFLSSRLLDSINGIIWFEAQGRDYWVSIYKMYKYLFLAFGLISLFIGTSIYLRFNVEGSDWFFYRENLFLGFIVVLCLAPLAQIHKKYK